MIYTKLRRNDKKNLAFGILTGFILVVYSPIVLAHGGHGNEFQGGDTAIANPESVEVDSETARRLGIKIEPATRKLLNIGIKTTGQIDILPSKQVEVTNPVPGKITELLVEPGALVRAGQPVAVLASAELAELRVTSQERRAEALANLKQAQADLQLAQENLVRQQKIATTEINRTQTEVNVAIEKYQRDQELANQGALPRRTMLESQAHLAEGKAQLSQAINQQEVIKAENEIKRAQVGVELANSRLQLSSTFYQARLQQLGAIANKQGLVVITAPIAGKVTDREVSLGQAFQDAGGKLMTIVNDSRVFATANIYEKDLAQVRLGQRVNVKVASLSNQTFFGKVSQIGTIVEGEKRVIPVKVELNNLGGKLKSGLFAELEIITSQTSTAILAIPSSAIVEVNGKNLVYVQNGNAFDGIEVTLGQTSGDLVEIKTGLFEGDLIVTQRALQLYAQSLKGGGKTGIPNAEGEGEIEHSTPNNHLKSKNSFETTKWLPLIIGGILGGTAFVGGTLWGSWRTRLRLGSTEQKEIQEATLLTQAYLENSHPDK